MHVCSIWRATLLQLQNKPPRQADCLCQLLRSAAKKIWSFHCLASRLTFVGCLSLLPSLSFPLVLGLHLSSRLLLSCQHFPIPPPPLLRQPSSSGSHSETRKPGSPLSHCKLLGGVVAKQTPFPRDSSSVLVSST